MVVRDGLTPTNAVVNGHPEGNRTHINRLKADCSSIELRGDEMVTVAGNAPAQYSAWKADASLLGHTVIKWGSQSELN